MITINISIISLSEMVSNVRTLTTKWPNVSTVLMAFIQMLAMFVFAFTFFNADDVIFGGSKDANDYNTRLNAIVDDNYHQISSHCVRDKSKGKALFNKSVLVVIDAFRADFVATINAGEQRYQRQPSPHSYSMPFTESIIKTNGIGLVSVSATPTVTLPRIKAIISGTLPSFMDYILNLSAYEFNGENLVENAWKAGKRVVFYGDDTWIQMFPSHIFHRSNGTSSFFATDYTQVDTNVTYNVENELKQLNDWDIMILHYLGVDHIGHSHGGFGSRLMQNKLLEMDDVIKAIYENASKSGESYVIVITGDHGMTDIGNHGGNTREETDTALIFVSTAPNSGVQNTTHVLQLDIASTLSSLLGLSIPNKSKGRLILPVLNAFKMDKEKQLCQLFLNAIQISHINIEFAILNIELLRTAFNQHIILIDNYAKSIKTKNNDFDFASKLYDNYISAVQTALLTTAQRRSIFSLLSVALILAIIPIFGLIVIELNNKHSIIFIQTKDMPTLFAYLTITFAILFLSSTSFIEMEHYYWFYMTSTLIVIYLVKSLYDYYQKSCDLPLDMNNNINKVYAFIITLIILRVTNYWNLLYEYDIGEWLDKQENKRILSALVICSLFAIWFLMVMSIKRFGKQHCLLISGLVCVYLYRSDVGSVSSFKIPFFPRVSRNFLAQSVYFHVSLIIFDTLVKRLKLEFNWNFLDNILPNYSTKNHSSQPISCAILRTLCTIWILLSALFLKVHNIPLLALNMLAEKIVFYAVHRKGDSYRAGVVLTYLCLAQSAFYSVGNSNTLSTIDVSPAFIGLDSYQPFLAGLFMVINMYSLYVYWILMLFIRLKESKLVMYASFKLSSIINLLLVIRYSTIAFYMCVAIILQNHLFIWSVLCPKFLYEASVTILIDIILMFVVANHIID